MINIQVEKSNNENSVALLRRFTKRVQGANILTRKRTIRYKERNQSKYKRKQRALTLIERRMETAELVKLGKIQEKNPR